MQLSGEIQQGQFVEEMVAIFVEDQVISNMIALTKGDLTCVRVLPTVIIDQGLIAETILDQEVGADIIVQNIIITTNHLALVVVEVILVIIIAHRVVTASALDLALPQNIVNQSALQEDVHHLHHHLHHAHLLDHQLHRVKRAV